MQICNVEAHGRIGEQLMSEEKIENQTKVNPNVIIINNARALMTMPEDKRKETIKKQLELIESNMFLVDKKEDGTEVKFEQDPSRITMVLIGLSSLQVYCQQFLIMHQRSKPDIKIVSPDQMPKA